MKGFDWKNILRFDSGAVLMILCGAVLALKPDAATALISVVLGWGLIAIGVGCLIAGFTGDGFGPIFTGALALLWGSWLHRNPLVIASFLGTVLGILVLTQGWKGMREVHRRRRIGGFWVLTAVVPVVEFLVGIRLIFSPMSASRMVLSICGIVMVICGICSLVSRYRVTKYIPEYDGIIDADE